MATAAGELREGMRYRAFFSYARADGKMAAKLHRSLDSYRVPKALRGMPAKRGPVPKTLHPIFRDREDLAGGGELGGQLRAALESSEALIVLCTPAAAQSEWVDEEIKLFREKNGNEAIFPVIGAGDPDSDDPEEQCMPPSLRDNAVLAADLRDIRKETGHIIGDGAAGGRQKLLAGLLGIELDQLRRRDDARRRRQMAAMAGALVLVLGLAGTASALGVAAQQNAERAERGEALAERRATAEAQARSRESAARQLADDQRRLAEAQRKLAEQQRALALANAAEAQRQTAIARDNAARAEAQFARAQGALAENFAQRGLAAADAGKRETALRYALAGARISPDSVPSQRVLLARLTAAPVPTATFDSGSQATTFLALSPDGSRLMTSGTDKVARLFDAQAGAQIGLGAFGSATKGTVGPSRGRAGTTRGMNLDPSVGGTKLNNNWFSADGRRFLISLENGTVEERDSATGELIGTFGRHQDAVLSASFHPDGERALTASLDGTARISWISGGEEFSVLPVPELRSAAWGPDGTSVVTMSLSRGLQIWRSGIEVGRLPNRAANAGALAITADGLQAIEIDEQGVVRLSRIADGQTEVVLPSDDVSRGAFVISADSRFVGVGKTDGHVVLWDIATRQPIADFAAHDMAISALGLSPDNRLLATTTYEGEVKVWNLLPVFAPYAQLAATYCVSLDAEQRQFTPDERAADPLINSIWGTREVC